MREVHGSRQPMNRAQFRPFSVPAAGGSGHYRIAAAEKWDIFLFFPSVRPRRAQNTVSATLRTRKSRNTAMRFEWRNSSG